MVRPRGSSCSPSKAAIPRRARACRKLSPGACAEQTRASRRSSTARRSTSSATALFCLNIDTLLERLSHRGALQRHGATRRNPADISICSPPPWVCWRSRCCRETRPANCCRFWIASTAAPHPRSAPRVYGYRVTASARCSWHEPRRRDPIQTARSASSRTFVRHSTSALHEIHAASAMHLEMSGPGVFSVASRATIKHEAVRLSILSTATHSGPAAGSIPFRDRPAPGTVARRYRCSRWRDRGRCARLRGGPWHHPGLRHHAHRRIGRLFDLPVHSIA